MALVIANLAAQLLQELESLVDGSLILFGDGVHFCLELAEVFIVARRLIVVVVNAHGVHLLLLLCFNLDLANALLVCVQLVRQHLVLCLLHLEDEV